MSVTFILGRAGAGKSRYCCDAILQRVADAPLGPPLLLIVPEQASAQAERTLLEHSPRGALSRARVLSFTRLTREILSEFADAPQALTPLGRQLALRAVTRRLEIDRGALGAAGQTPGFFRELDQVIGEWLRESIEPEPLQDAAEALPPGLMRARLLELVRIYQGFRQWLGPSRIDAADRPSVAAGRVARLAWVSQAELWLDGFVGLSGQELNLLEALARRAKHVHFTLLVDPDDLRTGDPDPLRLFSRTEQTLEALQQRFTEAGIYVTKPVRLRPERMPRFAAPALAALECSLAQPESRAGASGPSAVHIARFATLREELQNAARQIRAAVATSGGATRFSDCAVVFRDLRPHAALVEEVFAEAGVPCFLDYRAPQAAHALPRLVRGLLDAARHDLPTDTMRSLLATDLLPFPRGTIERLDQALRLYELRGDQAWRAATWPGCAGDDDDPARRQMADAIQAFVGSGGSSALAAREWTRRMGRLLAALQIRSQIARWIQAAQQDGQPRVAEVHRLTWEHFCEILREIEAILDQSPLTLAEFAEVLSAAVTEITLGLAPPTLDQTLIASIDRSRHPAIQHAWLVAFNDGIFPAAPAESGLLPSEQRERLRTAGVPVAAPAEDSLAERMLAYIACTRSSHTLTISFSESGLDGTPLAPSPLLAELRATGCVSEAPRAESPTPSSVRDAARQWLTLRTQPEPTPALTRLDALRAAISTDGPASRAWSSLTRGLHYQNEAAPVGWYLGGKRHEGQPVWNATATQIETYIQCPFQHFARFGLRLDAQRAQDPLRQAVGSWMHDLQAEAARTLRQRGVKGGDLSEEQRKALLAAVKLADDMIPGDSAEHTALIEQIRARAADLLAADAVRCGLGQFQIHKIEEEVQAELVTNGKLPPLRVRLRGRIDRIDRCLNADGSSWLLLADYKAGKSSFGCTPVLGTALQLFLYAALLRAAGEINERDQLAGVLVIPYTPAESYTRSDSFAQLDPDHKRAKALRPTGIFHEGVIRLLDGGCPDGAELVGPWRRKNGGELRSDSSKYVAPADRLAELERDARTLLAQAAHGVARGAIDLTPLLHLRTLACQSCGYGHVCRFELGPNKPRRSEFLLKELDPSAGIQVRRATTS